MKEIIAKRRKARSALWRKLRWPFLGLVVVAFVVFLVYFTSPATQSRWRVDHRAGLSLFCEKLIPATNLKQALDLIPEAIWQDARSAGVELGPEPKDETLLFLCWGGFEAIRTEDPLLLKALSGPKAPDIRLISLMIKPYNIKEPVASCFVSSDGRFIFVDLYSLDVVGFRAALIHGLAHSLAAKRCPPGLRSLINPLEGASYSPKASREFAFLDEAVALYLSDWVASGAGDDKGGGNESTWKTYITQRYDESGPFMQDVNLTFALSSNPKRPEYYAGAARFALAIVTKKDRGAFTSLANSLMQGSYGSIEELVAPLIDRGRGLPAALELYLGSKDIPE